MERPVFPRRSSVDELLARKPGSSWRDVMDAVKPIVESVRLLGEDALRAWSVKIDRVPPDAALFLYKEALSQAADQLNSVERSRLKVVAERIRTFAEAQRGCIADLDIPVHGGRAGHRAIPVENVGCYAPGGRYPLPSSVLMTVIPAKVAGVASVWVASPRPDPFLLSAASIAGADGVLVAGGAQAIAALAYGVGPVPASDLIVGPGNRYVTAAKKLISGETRIDMLAGPSELVIIADDSADPAFIAADLLAQAEHDDLAFPVLISLSKDLISRVESELLVQLSDLPTREIALPSLQNGGSLWAEDGPSAAGLSDRLAPEHLQISMRDPSLIQPLLNQYGTLFLGESSAEVFGDYGVGPNHVLPTGAGARGTAGLSVMTFLRIQTWLSLDEKSEPFERVARDSAWFARVEGLEAHARSAELRTTL